MASAASFATPGVIPSCPVSFSPADPALFGTPRVEGIPGWSAFLEAETCRAEREEQRAEEEAL